jgi:transposase
MSKQVSRQMLQQAYNHENDARVSARMLLVMRVRFDDMLPSHAAKDLHRDKSWATIWLRRFDKDGLEGLGTKPRSGRPPKVPRHIMRRIKRKFVKLQGGCRASEVRETIRKEAKVTYSEMQVYRILHSWDFRSVVPEKRLVREASTEERLGFKKRTQGC